MDNVRLLGQVSREQVLGLLRESRALLMPTQWYEGQPMVILESYSVGTPVVGSCLGNVKDMIIDGVTGCTFPCDAPQKLRYAILNLPDFDAAVICRHFDERYAEERNYEKLMEIYERCVEDVRNEKSSHHY